MTKPGVGTKEMRHGSGVLRGGGGGGGGGVVFWGWGGGLVCWCGFFGFFPFGFVCSFSSLS